MTGKRAFLAIVVLLLAVAAFSAEQLAAQSSADAAAETTHARGVLGGYEHGRVWGWAQRIGDDVPVTVRIEVDGEPVATLVADQPRADLVDKGLHPSGRAGFAGFIGELPDGARVEAFVEDARLTNAPCVVQGHGPVSSCTEGTSRGALGGYRAGQVWGWAQLVGHPSPVTVRIEADGAVIARAAATEPRPALVSQHHPPTGHAGFRLDVGPLRPGTQLEAFIEETGEPLMNTPLLVGVSDPLR